MYNWYKQSHNQDTEVCSHNSGYFHTTYINNMLQQSESNNAESRVFSVVKIGRNRPLKVDIWGMCRRYGVQRACSNALNVSLSFNIPVSFSFKAWRIVGERLI